MKAKILYPFLLLFVFSCSGVKKANRALYSGNYERAIELSVSRLQKNKQKKADFQHVTILEDAFQKMKTTYQARIDFLKKDVSTRSGEVYNLYLKLDRAQNQIKPLLPLHKANGVPAQFYFDDYSNEIIQTKEAYTLSLYEEGGRLMKGNKIDNRKAYAVFGELLKLHSNYKNTKSLREDAQYYGTDFVFVKIENNTQVVIPRRLESALLDFNTYGLDDFWTVYHASPLANTDYHYEVVLEFRDILISPERVAEKEIPLEREITETVYRTDRNGNYVYDSSGNRISDERTFVVKGFLNQVVQSKSVGVVGQVHYFDLQRNQRINTYPLQSEFVFENIFASFTGDERVLNRDEVAMTRNRAVPFPSNEQMLFDASNEVKSRFAAILKRYGFD